MKECSMARKNRTAPQPTSDELRDLLLEQYQQIMRETGCVLIHADSADKITFISDSITKLTGHTPETLIGQPYLALVREDWMDRARNHYAQAFENGATRAVYEFPVTTLDGADLRVRQNVIRLAEEGDVAYRVILQPLAESSPEQQPFRSRIQPYRTLARSLPNIAVMLFDRDLRYVIAEGSALDPHGLEGARMEGRTPSEVLPADVAEWLEEHYRQALEGAEVTFEYEVNERLMVVHIMPVRDEYGEVFAGMAILQDVTENRRVERALRENEQRFRGLFENNNDAVFFITLDGVIRAVNWQGADMLQRTVEELIGTTPADHIIDEEIPDSRRQMEQVLQGMSPPIYERTFRRNDGTTFPAEVSIALVYDGEGHPSHIQSIVRDISERKRTEEQLAQRVQQLTILREVDAELAERLSVDYVVNMALDSAMRLSAADAGFIGLLDAEEQVKLVVVLGDYHEPRVGTYLPEEDSIVARVLRTQEAEFIPAVRDDPNYIDRRPQTAAQITVPLVSQERLIGVLNLETSRPENFNEEVLEFVKLLAGRIASALDNARLYTQSEQQVIELQQLYDQIRRLEQLKTDMIRIASHDLRNPLATVLGYVELSRYELAELNETGDLADKIGEIEAAARRMQKIISDILSLERIEEMAQQAEHTACNLTEMVERIHHEHQSQARLFARELLLEDVGQDLIVTGDAAQIAEAMNNLVSNAIKYTREEVKIRLYREGERVRFEVEDNGYGIREDQQEKLFQPFYRARSKETREIEGTGLGLHLVKNIIERHGGEIYFRSVYGQGSTFGFSLPLVES
jgi:PAS domain S-box-containing protein